MSKKNFRLADPSTGFYDPETQLKVVRDSVVSIDMGKGVGVLTTGAIRAGRLVEVNTKSKEAEQNTSNNEDEGAQVQSSNQESDAVDTGSKSKGAGRKSK